MEPMMLTNEEALIEICADELWGGVYCSLPPGHAGSHESSPSHGGGCALTWRADATPPPAPLPAMPHIESFLRMVRGASAHR
jgi:hypothetical protein